MRIRGIGRIRWTDRWIKSKFSPRALILLYHRVIQLSSDPHLLCVTPQHFAEHLEILRKNAHPLSLQQLAQTLRNGKLPPRGVVVTFDDGYADNFYNAKPLLEHYDTPATVFVTTGYIGCKREFWWDELDRLLLQPGTLPETLNLCVNGGTYHWQLGDAADYSEDAYRRHYSWNAGMPHDPTRRHSVYRFLHQLLRPLSEGERRKVLDDLLAWAGEQSMARPTYRTLSPDEVVQLVEGGLLEVGAHTMSHPVLSALPAAAQRAEIQEGKARLEEMLGHSVTSFAYPYGSRSDYTAETIAIVGEAGFVCACSNFAGLVRRGVDRFQLPRVMVRDWDGEEFGRRLWGWFRG